MNETDATAAGNMATQAPAPIMQDTATQSVGSNGLKVDPNVVVAGAATNPITGSQSIGAQNDALAGVVNNATNADSSSPQIPGHTVTPTTNSSGAAVTPPAGSTPVTIGGSDYHATPTATTTSDPNTISSSSTLQSNANAGTALSTATGTNTATLTPAQNAQINSAATAYSNLSGVTVNPSDIAALMQADPTLSVSAAALQASQLAAQGNTLATAKAATAAANTNEASQYNADLAAQNAQYAASSQQIDTDRANNISSATAQLAQLNTSGGISSDAGQFLAHINAQYDLAQNQLTLQAQQAQAALDAGNAQSYAAINQNMQTTIATVNNNISNILASIQGNQVAAAQTATDNQQKATTLYNGNLSTLTSASPLASFSDSSGNPVTDPSQLTPAQLKTFQASSTYQQGTAAGLSPQAILGDVANAVKTSKASEAVQAQTDKNTALQDTLIKTQIQAQEINNTVAGVQGGVITSSTGYKYVDGSQYFGATTENLARATAQQLGVKFMSKTDVATEQSIENVRAQFSSLTSNLSGTLATDAAGRPIVAAENFGSSALEINANIASMGIYANSAIDFFKAVTASAGSNIRITAGEIKTAQSWIPSTSDTAATAAAKINKLNNFLDIKEASLFPGQKPTTSPTTNNSTASSTSAITPSLMAQIQAMFNTSSQ